MEAAIGWGHGGDSPDDRADTSDGAHPADRAATTDTADERHHDSHILHLPAPRVFVRHALPAVIEAAVGPAVLFYVVLVLAGFHGALIAAMVWSCLAAARRVVRRERIPALLVLGIVLLAVRTAVAYATGSAFLYFIQPTASTFLVALLFAGTALVKRPLIERLAHEFCPLDPVVMSRPLIRKFFLRLSVLWFAVMTVNAGTVLWLLLESSVRAFVVERTVVNTSLTVGAIVLSSTWFLRVMKAAGISVRFGGPAPALALAEVPAVVPAAARVDA